MYEKYTIEIYRTYYMLTIANIMNVYSCTLPKRQIKTPKPTRKTTQFKQQTRLNGYLSSFKY